MFNNILITIYHVKKVYQILSGSASAILSDFLVIYSCNCVKIMFNYCVKKENFSVGFFAFIIDYIERPENDRSVAKEKKYKGLRG